MWFLYVHILAMKLMIIGHLVSGKDTETASYQWCRTEINNETRLLEHCCQQCSMCERGTYLIQNCSKSMDTVCKECPIGTYSNRENSAVCHPCTDCADHGKSGVIQCSQTEDSVCSCTEGTYLLNGTCVPCSNCPPGKQVSKTCGNDSDTECTTCRPGSFSTQENSNTYCDACHVCYKNRIKIQNCSPTTNTICGECKKGYYKEENTAHCAKCSYCYPEFPGYTFQVSACLDLVHDPNYTCMPVTVPPFVGVIGNELDVSTERTSLISTEFIVVSTTTSFSDKQVHTTLSIVPNSIIIVFLIIMILMISVSIIYFLRRQRNNLDGTKFTITKMCCKSFQKLPGYRPHPLFREESIELGQDYSHHMVSREEGSLQMVESGFETQALDSIESCDSGFVSNKGDFIEILESENLNLSEVETIQCQTKEDFDINTKRVSITEPFPYFEGKEQHPAVHS